MFIVENPGPSQKSQSLAGGAEGGGPGGESDFGQGRPTARTRLRTATVDLVGISVSAFLAGWEAVIPQGGSTGVDRPAKDRLNAVSERRDPRRVESVGSLRGVDPVPMQGLVDVDVAKPGDQGLIQQGGLDRTTRTAETSFKLLRIDGGRFRTETSEQPPLEIRSRFVEVDASESPGVDEGEPSLGPILRPQDPDRMSVRWRPADPTTPEVDPSRHAETKDQAGFILESQDQLLSSTIHPLDAEAGAQMHRVEPSAPATTSIAHHVPSADPNPVNRRSDEFGRQGSTNGLDFGKFRHDSESDA